MNNYIKSPAMQDLDGLSFPQDFRQHGHYKDEFNVNSGFGFDPSSAEQELCHRYSNDDFMLDSSSPQASGSVSEWPSDQNLISGYSSHTAQPPPFRPLTQQYNLQQHANSLHIFQKGPQMVLNKLDTTGIPKGVKSHPQHGRMTPPRSNSASSEQSKREEVDTQAAGKRCRVKTQPKLPPTPKDSVTPVKRKRTAGRKRASTSMSSQGERGDEKRKASLEKNRVAAAKCRINKKEKTEQLQRDSHIKAKENADLRGVLELMENEIRKLTTIASAHANCPDCQDSQQIRQALQLLQERRTKLEFSRAKTDSASAHSPAMSHSAWSMASSQFDMALDTSNPFHPPLPDFDMSEDFEVRSPQSLG